MCIIGTPEADDKEPRINAHPMVASESCGLAKECKCLFDEEVRVNGLKGHRKHKKREDEHKLKKELITYKIRMMLRWWG